MRALRVQRKNKSNFGSHAGGGMIRRGLFAEAYLSRYKFLMKALGKRPQFDAVGTRLIEAAVRKSIEEGFKGRVGLHSLPGA